MPVLPKIDFDENYNREDEENCSDSDDDIKLHDTKQVLPFEDVRAYDGHMDKISPSERRYVIEKIQLGFELMRLESTRIQAKIDAANLRCAKLRKLAEEQEKVIANSTYLFSQTTPSSKEEEKSTDAPKKVMKRKKKKNVGLLLGETKDKFSQSTDEGYASKAAATPEANDKTIKMLKKKKNVKVKAKVSQNALNKEVPKNIRDVIELQDTVDEY
uniref:Uncharacterized protein n=1 Tax=Panagrolaimus davidi TaxID=227884 RepID=A0A914PVF3_9BILA